MQWVTRERPKTDRVACPWLIKRFIDPEAEIVYVPRSEVLSYPRSTAPTPSSRRPLNSHIETASARSRCWWKSFVYRTPP